MFLKELRHHRLVCLLRRGGLVFTTGILVVDEAQKMLSRNKLQESGTSSHARSFCFVEHEILHEQFHVTHFAGCAVLFNKDTFYTDISVKSIYLHDTAEHGGVLYGVVSRASFRRAAASGQTFFTVLSLHMKNVYAKKRGIAMKIIQAVRAVKISQDIDLVEGDFNGAAWRCRSRDSLSSNDEAFADCDLSWMHPEQLGGRLWFSQASQFSALLEGEQAWCFLFTSTSSRFTRQ